MYPTYSYYVPGEPGPEALHREELARERRKSSKKARRTQQSRRAADAIRSEHLLSAARFVRLS